MFQLKALDIFLLVLQIQNYTFDNLDAVIRSPEEHQIMAKL